MEYLEIIRPDKRYCDGCFVLMVTETTRECWPLEDTKLKYREGKTLTPPNCPLKKWDDINCPRCDCELGMWRGK
jgi:hypothetical protein